MDKRQEHYELIFAPTGWLDCDIIHRVHVCLEKLKVTIEGLQRPTLCPCKNFKKVNGLSQIVRTGNSHWVCVGSLGCVHAEVNLYDSWYHNVIDHKVKSQVSSWSQLLMLLDLMLFLSNNKGMAVIVVYFLLHLQLALFFKFNLMYNFMYQTRDHIYIHAQKMVHCSCFLPVKVIDYSLLSHEHAT